MQTDSIQNNLITTATKEINCKLWDMSRLPERFKLTLVELTIKWNGVVRARRSYAQNDNFRIDMSESNPT